MTCHNLCKEYISEISIFCTLCFLPNVVNLYLNPFLNFPPQFCCKSNYELKTIVIFNLHMSDLIDLLILWSVINHAPMSWYRTLFNQKKLHLFNIIILKIIIIIK